MRSGNRMLVLLLKRAETIADYLEKNIGAMQRQMVKAGKLDKGSSGKSVRWKKRRLMEDRSNPSL